MIYAASDAGTKPINEDSFCICTPDNTIISIQSQREDYTVELSSEKQNGCLLAVADGISSLYDSKNTSMRLIRSLSERFPSISLENGRYIRHILQNISWNIERECSDGNRRGTTAALIYMEGNHAYCANVGDTSIYLIHNGEMKKISVDDTKAAELIRSGTDGTMIGEAEFHQLTQYIGQPEFPEPHLIRIEPDAGDLLVVMSDAFVPKAEDITDLMKQPGNPAVKLIEKYRNTRTEPYMDNCTVMIAQTGLPAENKVRKVL